MIVTRLHLVAPFLVMPISSVVVAFVRTMLVIVKTRGPRAVHLRLFRLAQHRKRSFVDR
jgi:hypothetical protein